MHTVLVTGASGFLGQHLIGTLLDSDADLRIRAFSRSRFPGADNRRIESICGDITDPQAVESALDGADEVYHLAGFVKRSPDDNWALYRTHVGGTRNLCDAMLKQGPRPCVLVSSSGTVAVSREAVEHDEESGYKQEVVHEFPYYLSKIYQEKQALWYHEHRGLPIVVANPSLLLGPGDDRLSSTNDLRLFLQGQIKTVPTGGLSLVDVRDVADGLVRAMRKGTPGERYLLAGENLTFREWIAHAANVANVRPPRVKLPERLARTGAAILRRAYPMAGKRFELDDATIRMSSLFWYCDTTKARRDLGFATRPADETLRETVAYLRSSGAASRQ